MVCPRQKIIEGFPLVKYNGIKLPQRTVLDYGDATALKPKTGEKFSFICEVPEEPWKGGVRRLHVMEILTIL